MRILQSRCDRQTDPRTFSSLAATNRSEYLTVKHITKKPICCLSWSSREDWSTDLCQKFRAKQPAQTNTIELEDMIIISSETIPYTEQNFVYCVFWRSIISIEPFIQPQTNLWWWADLDCIYFIAMLGTICVLNSAASIKLFFTCEDGAGQFHQSWQGNKSDLRLFPYQVFL